MKTRYIAIPIVMIAVLALAAFSTPAMACTNCCCICEVETNGTCSNDDLCSYGTNGTVEGALYVKNGGPDSSDTVNDIYKKDFNVPSGTIKWACVYWHIWGGNPQGDGWTNATFCNATQCWTDNQSIPEFPSCNNPGNRCNHTDNHGYYMGGCGTHWVYWNVTNNVTAGELNNLTVNNGDGDWDGATMWITMVVVLEITDYSESSYWINQGYEDLQQNSKSTTWFNGTILTGNYTLWHHALASNAANSKYFNGQLVESYCPGGSCSHENLKEKSIPSGWIEDDGNQNMTWDNTGDPWLHPVVAILGKALNDLTVTDIDVGTPRPNNDSTVEATVKNWGDEDTGHFNVSLYVDDVLNGTVNVTAGLSAGTSTTVSFTKVNESKGCYDFKVIVDVDGIIDEANEDNNATTVSGQVGYVIEVNSFSDFDDLVTESTNNLLGAGNVSHSGDTYYIKNFTGSSAIENCAGDGISIQNLNTSTKFEIKNCTIEDCTGSGVFLHNLTNGTIKDSTVQNNTEYGIEVGLVSLDSDDPDHVNITNNTIDDNKYGIELIGFNCTVKNNTITNSSGSGYGIYLLANDTNVTYNVIQNNTDYGVKLYNSSRCYVYGNDFICNNFDYSARVSQGCDENGNDNHWNTSTIGNNWTDWDDNTPTNPANYSIDCDSNKDYKPRGLFVFSCNAGTDKWAFRLKVDGSPTASDPNTEFTDAQYDKIKEDDNDRQYDASGDAEGYYAAHRFNFSLNSSLTSGIDKINVTWIGKGDHDVETAGAKLRVWKDGTGYEQLDTTNSPNWGVTLTGGVTNATGTIFTDYINTNNVTILVNQNSESVAGFNSYIWTDYIRLVITPK